MIYFDNGATSFPKPKEVTDAILDYMINNGRNINRGNYTMSYEAEDIVFETRELIAQFFGYNKGENVIFTKNITESLNTILFGLLKEGDHVIVSSMEHNAVMRPLSELVEKRAVTFSRAICDKEGNLSLDSFKKELDSHKNTKAVVMTHASNICGTILNLEEVGKICKEKGVFFIIDTAQTAGAINVDMKKIGANALAFTGHKSLLGPQGIGGFIVDDEINSQLNTFIFGGTGSVSQSEIQPQYMPDKFESGTQNLPAIYGLNAGIKYINNKGIDAIHNYEMELTELFIEGVSQFNNVHIIGKKSVEGRVPTVSLIFDDLDLARVSHTLSKEGGIETRCGLHCCPSGHKTLGTFPEGTVRFSFGQFNTKEEVLFAIDFIKKHFCQKVL
ncbi:MAG: aminotransferase class V-fold PLP-dependent enzyme [Oscillospiraceae bacterium]